MSDRPSSPLSPTSNKYSRRLRNKATTTQTKSKPLRKYVMNDDGEIEYEEEMDIDEEEGVQSHEPNTPSKAKKGSLRRKPLIESDDDDTPVPEVSNDFTTPTPSTITTKAHVLKKQVLAALDNPLPLKPDPQTAEKDLEEEIIHHHRTEKHPPTKWSLIATELNTQRTNHGGDPSWTPSAVYARFIRGAGPRRLNQSVGSEDEEPKPKKRRAYRRKKKDHEGEVGGVPKLGESNQIMLVEAYRDVREKFWERVADAMRVKSGRKFSAEQCEKMFGEI